MQAWRNPLLMSSEPSDLSERSRSVAGLQPLSSLSPSSLTFRVPRTFPRWLPLLLYFVLACLFLWRSVFTGQVFLPAGILGHVAPYTSVIPTEVLPPWNPLRWDSMAQFYPWRNFYAQSLRDGIVPLWNPYQFCGTPFVANSQSAVYYPPNLVFVVFPVIRAFAVNAVLHLTLCGWFTFLLLRRLCLAEIAALTGGVIFAFSAWQTQWLQLPTFLATSCWFPLLLWGVHRIFTEERQNKIGQDIATLSAILGLMLLAGHLQIAFYGLLAGTLFAVALVLRRTFEGDKKTALRGFLACVASLALGLMLCAPQLLPSLELSRVSHRVGKPSAAGYAAYTEYALPFSGFATLTLPNFFGNDYDANNPYWGFYEKRVGDLSVPVRHNAAETAAYAGLLPLLLSVLALLRIKRRRDATPLSNSTSSHPFASLPPMLFFAILALIALLMALGTPINALFYFGVPGFGQSGSPGRVLCLWALSVAVLASYGLDSLLRSPPTKREIGIAALTLVFVLAFGMLFAARQVGAVSAQFLRGTGIPEIGEVFGRIGEDWLRLVMFGGTGIFALFFAGKARENKREVIGWLSAGLCTLDLFVVGVRVNPTALAEWVYPPNTVTDALKRDLGHERVFPTNQAWSLYRAPIAILPPNGGMVYGLHDTQGYDSLLTGQYKAFANSLSLPNRMGVRDASPPEVGNMVFTQNPDAPNAHLTGSKVSLSIAGGIQPMPSVPASSPPLSNLRAYIAAQNVIFPVEWKEDSPTRVTLVTLSPSSGTLHLQDQFYPGWRVTVDGAEKKIEPQKDAPFREVEVAGGTHTVAFRFRPESSRVGFYLMCLGLGIVAGLWAYALSLNRGGRKDENV